MRRHLYTSALALAAVALATSACGSSPGTTNTSAMDAGGAPATGAAAQPGSGLPANNMAEEEGGGGNDGEEAQIPQGMAGAKAVAAGMGRDGLPVISVTGTETTCTPDKTTVPAGEAWFKMTNQGTRISEMYLESPDGTELVEVEKIKKGETGAFKATVKAGNYLIACEPGMADKQVRTGITVTG